MTIHNFPEGLAVGVAFAGGNFKSAVAVTIGIGLQNFPEGFPSPIAGLAVSLPLRRMGFSKARCFFWGQFSGMVEPLGGLLGAGIVSLAQPLLPFCLSFAAGAMIFVVPRH